MLDWLKSLCFGGFDILFAYQQDEFCTMYQVIVCPWSQFIHQILSQEPHDNKYKQGNANSAPRLAYIPNDYHPNHSNTVNRDFGNFASDAEIDIQNLLIAFRTFSILCLERINEGVMKKDHKRHLIECKILLANCF